MPLTTGARLGVYEITGALGAGGMGEVYRARDTRLDRDVALKILPEFFASDPDRLMRFEREAKTLATLNHPNIAQIYGLEILPPEGGSHPKAGGGSHGPALVMELVEGDDLSQQIARGPIPLMDALAMARQIADALEAAHEAGIIHRDLKPANIKVRPDGTVKILDFGLAKAMSSPEGLRHTDDVGRGSDDVRRVFSPAVADSPTITSPALTQMGVILGTAAYMAPEQARGQAVDRRADVWAFGNVLFEMLTGSRPFPGDTVSDILASVLAREPDLAALPPDVPPRLVELLRRCLEKAPKKRWQAIGDVRHELEVIATNPVPAAAVAPASVRPLWRKAGPVIAAGLGGAALVLALGTGTARVTPAPVSRLLIEAPDRTGPIAISPDGSRLAIVTGRQLMLRTLADFTVVPVAGVDFPNLANLLFSPDGESVVFSTDSSVKRVPVGGGVAVEIAQLPGGALGLSWDGESLLAGLGAGGITRLPVGGGPATTLVTLGASEFAARPQMLPGGKKVLFTMTSGGQRADWRAASVVVQSLESGKREVVVSPGTDGRYLPTGHLVYAVDGVWFGAVFDVSEHRMIGLPVPLVAGIGRYRRAGLVEPSATVTISDSGTLVYGTGPTSFARPRALVRTDRLGAEESLNLPPNSYESPRISPDGRLLAVSSGEDPEAIIWIYDLSGQMALRRLTFSGSNRLPVWSPDSARLAFQSSGGAAAGIFVRRMDGTGEAERLTVAEPGTVHVPESWSRDGYLAYSKVTNQGAELWLYSTAEKRASRFGDVHSSDPLNASFSPDGRWIAYTDRGPAQGARVFVQPVPATGALYQISPDGDAGHHPFWSAEGRELLYIGVGGGRMVSTPVTVGAGLTFGNARPLKADLPSNTTARGPLAYAITQDGRSFIWAKPLDRPATETQEALRVVLGWFQELERLLPGAR